MRKNNKKKQTKLRRKYNQEYYKTHRKQILKQKKEYSKKMRRSKKFKIKIAKQGKKYREHNKIKIANRGKKYRKLRAKTIKQRMQKYNELNKVKIAKRQHEYYLAHKAHLAKKRKEWNKINKKKIRKQQTEYQKQRRHTNMQYKLSETLRNRIKGALQGHPKIGSAIKGLKCSLGYLIAYLQNKFYGKMTWDNWGEVWELDHVVPLWKFDLTNPKQFLKAVNYTNLQPLTIKDHKKKTAKEASERRAIRINK